ncbi:hypothetical protein JCM11641_000032 [Rhodosporidiobolus odoratus]
MDNVIFQVETALLASSSSSPADEGKANLLKRTFYGSTLQTLTFSPPVPPSITDPVRTQTEPFSSLLVDVPPLPFPSNIFSSVSRRPLQRPRPRLLAFSYRTRISLRLPAS